MRKRGVEDAMSFAFSDAVLFKNAYGSEVEFSGEANSAELRLLRCSNLEVALELAREGLPVSRETHCVGCVNYMRALAEELGLSLEVELREGGCVMKVRK